jgi:hypothetical protein
VTVEWRADQWLRTVALPSIEDGLDAYATKVHSVIKISIRGPRGSPPGGPPGMDQGRLVNSLGWARSGNLQRRVFANVPYAQSLERGATIRGKSGRFLTVPLTDEAKKIRRQYRTLREVPKLFVIRAKSGRLLLVREAGRGKTRRTELLFVLVRTVTMHKRPFMAPGLERAAPEAQRIFNREFRAGMRRRTGDN